MLLYETQCNKNPVCCILVSSVTRNEISHMTRFHETLYKRTTAHCPWAKNMSLMNLRRNCAQKRWTNIHPVHALRTPPPPPPCTHAPSSICLRSAQGQPFSMRHTEGSQWTHTTSKYRVTENTYDFKIQGHGGHIQPQNTRSQWDSDLARRKLSQVRFDVLTALLPKSLTQMIEYFVRGLVRISASLRDMCTCGNVPHPPVLHNRACDLQTP